MLQVPLCPHCGKPVRTKPRVGRVNHTKVRRKKTYTGSRWAGKYYCGQCGVTVPQEEAVKPWLRKKRPPKHTTIAGIEVIHVAAEQAAPGMVPSLWFFDGHHVAWIRLEAYERPRLEEALRERGFTVPPGFGQALARWIRQ